MTEPGSGRLRPPRVLCIAGSDCSGGAGIQADIKTIAMLGGYAMTAITAITVQDTLGVHAVAAMAPDLVVAQAAACAGDIGIDAVKIGMLGSAAVAGAVADWLEGVAVPVVFDPVMVATSGGVLADGATVAAFARLMALATVVTPNLPELAALGGRDAVMAVARAVLVKGGHGAGDEIEDRLIAPGREVSFRSQRVATRHTHGTGCTLASAIAVGLGAGLTLEDAAGRGIAFVGRALRNAPGYGAGHGPMGHMLGRVPFDDAVAAVGGPDGWAVT